MNATLSRPTAGLNLMRKLAWAYAAMFLFIAILNYIPIPALKDAEGRLCGLFKLDWWDDALHFGSCVWAAVAAWRSTRASVLYFKLFGVLYFADSIIGLIFGQAYLDLGIFLFGPAQLPWLTKIGANAPHVFIGGIAVWIGFVLSRKHAANE